AQFPGGRERGAGKQILEKEGPQSFNRCLIKGGKKAGEGRTVRQLITTKEGHKRFHKWGEAFIKGLQCGFARNGVADEHDDKIDEVVLPKARTGEAHLVLDGLEHPRMREHLSKGCHLSHPGRG